MAFNLTYVGKLPTQLAALNRTNINVQELTVEAAMTLEKDKIYQAALMDPHASSELSISEIKSNGGRIDRCPWRLSVSL